MLSALNTGNVLEIVNYEVYDWTSGCPELIYQDSLYIQAYEAETVFLKLVDDCYELLEINCFSVDIVLPSDNSIIASIFTTVTPSINLQI